MKIECIFEIVEGALAAIKYKDEPLNSFEYCFDLWEDIEYLEEYFEKNKDHLASDFWQMDIVDAITKTLDEAEKFKDDILYFAEQGKKTSGKGLEGTIFTSLHKEVLSNTRIPSKAYGADHKNSIYRDRWCYQVDSRNAGTRSYEIRTAKIRFCI